MPPPHVPAYKKLLSYIVPVRVKHTSSIFNEVLDVYFYFGQWQLATVDALYSDGNRYRPVIAALKKMKHRLPAIKKVLILGAGLGSAVKILNDKGYHPQITLVDIDEQVLQLALEFCDADAAKYITPVCMNAADFVKECRDNFDLIFVDIFKGRDVPAFVMQNDFLENSHRLLNSGGCFMLNYIINNDDEWKEARKVYEDVFPGSHIIQLDINRVFVTLLPTA